MFGSALKVFQEVMLTKTVVDPFFTAPQAPPFATASLCSASAGQLLFGLVINFAFFLDSTYE